MIARYVTYGEAETVRLARALARDLKAGDAVLLEGDLGTGKSVLARGIARELGVQGAMPSPTFVLMIPYEGRVSVCHMDLYRLGGPDEFEAAGLSEAVGADAVALVEWPELADLQPDRALRLRLSRGSADDERIIDVVENTAGVALPDAETLME